MRRAFVAGLGLVSLMLVLPAEAGTIYFNDFESPVGAEWSSTSSAITPPSCTRCTTFLGVFDNQTVSLALGGLPSHTELTVGFSLFILNSWDGNNPDFGPDFWSLAVAGGPTLLNTTFSNVPGIFQSYPDPYVAAHAYRTGAAQTETLGYEVAYRMYGDSVYDLSYTIPHSAGSVQFNFTGSNLQGWPDEGWGLDNVSVGASGIPEPATLALAGVGLALVAFRARRRR